MNRRAVALALPVLFLLLSLPLGQAVAQTAEPGNPIVLAHYYIWFEPASWNRAKSDLPLAGRYDSSDVNIMRHHIELAKSAGIQGFIVSWKSTDRLNARLDQLVRLAVEMEFKLAITYQGLDFDRKPLAAERVAADLDVFINRWADSPAFTIFGRPLVVWTGTWENSVETIASVTSSRRSRLLILASEKSVAGYRRIADLVDGDLYYWSSVNPTNSPMYPKKLVDMGNAVRSRGQLWIAPAAPGFDAQLVGGTRVVTRNDGRTLRDSWNGALSSVPDAIGLISWNEFSENTHIEPSTRYGTSALDEVAKLIGSPKPRVIAFDSSAPGGRSSSSSWGRVALLGALGLFVVLSVTRVWHRQRRSVGPTETRTT